MFLDEQKEALTFLKAKTRKEATENFKKRNPDFDIERVDEMPNIFDEMPSIFGEMPNIFGEIIKNKKDERDEKI